MTANEYVNTLFQYISDLFKRPPFNECRNGSFPPNYVDTVKVLFKKLFRVYAHVYHHHLNVRSMYKNESKGIRCYRSRSSFEHFFQTFRAI